MLSESFALLARLCAQLQQAGHDVICTAKDESSWAWMFIQDPGGEVGTYEIAVMDIDLNLDDLLVRCPSWQKDISQHETIRQANLRLVGRLVKGGVSWAFNQEIVTVRVGEQVYFLIVANACLP